MPTFDETLNITKNSENALKVSFKEFSDQNKLDIWKAINEEVKTNIELNRQNLSLEQMFKDLAEDREEKQNKLDRAEYNRRKKLADLELKLIKAKQEHDKKAQKNINDEIKLLEKKFNLERKAEAEKDEREARRELNKQIKETQKEGKELISQGWREGNLSDIIKGAKDALTGGLTGGAGLLKGIDTIVSGLADISKKLDRSIEEIVKYKSDWDTRLFGSGTSHTSLTQEITNSIGASPYVKQADVMRNIDEAVKAGIAYNIEQRAFLQTVKDDIAGTFNAFDSTLLQIIRIQQSDSTAARLGMEASLNQYLNSMFKNTEYLNSISDNVTNALYEATSLLGSEQSIGFEYQVQKWLGSLYSVGMSSQSINSIAQALGQIASGDISGVNSGAGRLLIMSSAKSGLSYNELLTKGLNDSQMNKLMESMVEYLKSIADSNRVVQSQYASIFGLSTSDIVAASNLSTADINNISKYALSSSGAIGTLLDMGSTISSRMGMGEKMATALSNLEYTMASSIASNPAMYAIWSISGMLDKLMGGMPIPFVSTLGTGVDLETTVADLMRVGVMGTGLLSGVGSLINAANASAGESGIAGILKSLGATKNTTVTRGTGLAGDYGSTSSGSTYIGNTSGSDIYNASMYSAEEKKVEALKTQEPDENETNLTTINDSIMLIYNMFSKVIVNDKLNVRVGDNMAFSDNNPNWN